MESLLSEVAAAGISVVLSSHVVAELDQVADYLIVLGRGQVLVSGEVSSLVAARGVGLEKLVLSYLREASMEVAA
jgi:ABC-2 type transport system ATP-binding protein